MSAVGKLSARVTLFRPVRTPDGGGGHEIIYEDRGAVWAAAEDRPAALGRLGARAVKPRRRFTVRDSVPVMMDSRLAHDGTMFGVRDIRRTPGPKPYLIVDAVAL